MMPESEISVFTPNVFMPGRESRSRMASPNSLSLPVHDVWDKNSITIANAAIVMLMDACFTRCSGIHAVYRMMVDSPIQPPMVTESPFLRLRKKRSSVLGKCAE